MSPVSRLIWIAGRVLFFFGSWVDGWLRCFPDWFVDCFRVPRWAPLVGNIDKRALVRRPSLDFAGLQTTSAPVLKIRIDGDNTAPGALRFVAKELFFGDAPFTINVCYACAPDGYADPTSIWFNIFFGYYQIDVPFKAPVDVAPFGYNRDIAEDGSRMVDPVLLATIGEADWNYFSNYLYGVPESNCTRHAEVDKRPVVRPRVKIGTKQWDCVDIKNAVVVSSYEARPGDVEIAPASFLRGVFRAAFGETRRVDRFQQSFFPTSMDGKLFLSWRTDLKRKVHSTLIFGATCAADYPSRALCSPADAESENARFLQAQIDELVDIIRTEYPCWGFPSD